MKKNIQFLLLCFLLSCATLLPAEVITFHSGKSVTGTILERTEGSIKVDSGIGVAVTYFLDEIADIKAEDPVVQDSEPAESISPAPAHVLTSTGAAIPSQQQPRSFIWKVNSPTTEVYILGSIHVANKDFYPLSDVIEKAYAQCDVLAVEADVLNANQLELQNKAVAKATYTDGRKLTDELSGKTEDLLNQYLKRNGLDMRAMATLKPWMVAITIAQIEFQKLGFESKYGIDNHFLKKAFGNKPIVELEGVEMQFDLMDSLQDQDLLLYYSLLDIAEVEKFFNEIVKAWKAGDSSNMERITITHILEEYPQMEKIFDDFLFKRNEGMTEKIEVFLRGEKRYFVVVGSAHLIGPRGVIEILKQKGYTVSQL